MTAPEPVAMCALCGSSGTASAEPPRRTFARGADPEDASFSIIAVLPDIPHCESHAEEFGRRKRTIGWCDDERCRLYGEVGAASPCGVPYKELRR